MKVIDFDARFREVLTDWMRQNVGKFDDDALEAQASQLYARFIKQRQSWLDGLSPEAYFAGIHDADALVHALLDYAEADVAVPDLLPMRIVELGDAAIAPLMALVRDTDVPARLRATALELLIELDTPAPVADCLSIIDGMQEGCTVAGVAARLLRNRGAALVPEMLARLTSASAPARVIYLDLLCNFPGDECIYNNMVHEFSSGEQRALYASLLGRLGDQRALPVLLHALDLEDIDYLDYLAIADAIELLGGDAGNRDRDFSLDPYYESLRQLS